MQKTNYTRAFVGDIPRLSRDKQLEICALAVGDLPAIYGPKEFDLYIHNLRSDEVAVVARLIAIAERKPKERAGVAFVQRLLKLLDNCAYILDAESGIKSTDGDNWYAHVKNTHNKITNGRELSSDNARRLAKKSHDAREPGLYDHWTAPAMAKEHKQMAQHWRDPEFKNAQEAIAASPDKELQTVSVSTWTRIFGRRTVSHK